MHDSDNHDDDRVPAERHAAAVHNSNNDAFAVYYDTAVRVPTYDDLGIPIDYDPHDITPEWTLS